LAFLVVEGELLGSTGSPVLSSVVLPSSSMVSNSVSVLSLSLTDLEVGVVLRGVVGADDGEVGADAGEVDEVEEEGGVVDPERPSLRCRAGGNSCW